MAYCIFTLMNQQKRNKSDYLCLNLWQSASVFSWNTGASVLLATKKIPKFNRKCPESKVYATTKACWLVS